MAVDNKTLVNRISKLEKQLKLLNNTLDPILKYQSELSYATDHRCMIVSCDASVSDEHKAAFCSYIITKPDKTYKEFCMQSSYTDSNIAELDAVYNAIEFISISELHNKNIKFIEIRSDNENVIEALNGKQIKNNETFIKKVMILLEENLKTLREYYKVDILWKKRRSTHGLMLADRLCKDNLRNFLKD